MIVAGEDVGEVSLTGFTGELRSILNNLHIRRNLLDGIHEALLTELCNGTGGRNVENDDFAGGADFIDNVLSAFNAHGFVIAGYTVNAVCCDLDIEVYNNDALIDCFLNRHFHAFPLRESNDSFCAPGLEVVDLRSHFLSVVAGVELVVDSVAQLFAALLSVICNACDPTVGNSRCKDADLGLFRGSAFLGRRGRLGCFCRGFRADSTGFLRGRACGRGSVACACCEGDAEKRERQNNAQYLFHVCFLLYLRSAADDLKYFETL